MTSAPRLSKQKIFSNFSKKEARVDEARTGHASTEGQHAFASPRIASVSNR
jgi:hypothetical protein